MPTKARGQIDNSSGGAGGGATLPPLRSRGMIGSTPFGSAAGPPDWFESLRWLTAALGRSSTRGEFCGAALDVLGSALGVTRSAVLLLDGQGRMRFECWRGLSDEYRRAVAGHSPWTQGGTAPQAFAIEDASAAESLASLRTALVREGIASLAFVPLLEHGRLLGKFMLYSDAPRRFTGAELGFATAVGNHIAFAVERQAGDDLIGSCTNSCRRRSASRASAGSPAEWRTTSTTC